MPQPMMVPRAALSALALACAGCDNCPVTTTLDYPFSLSSDPSVRSGSCSDACVALEDARLALQAANDVVAGCAFVPGFERGLLYDDGSAMPCETSRSADGGTCLDAGLTLTCSSGIDHFFVPAPQPDAGPTCETLCLEIFDDGGMSWERGTGDFAGGGTPPSFCGFVTGTNLLQFGNANVDDAGPGVSCSWVQNVGCPSFPNGHGGGSD